MLTDKEYIAALENTLIFMCQTYRDCAKEFMYRPDTCNRFPVIQGAVNQIAIQRASKLPVNHKPQHGIADTLKELMERRGLEDEQVCIPNNE